MPTYDKLPAYQSNHTSNYFMQRDFHKGGSHHHVTLDVENHTPRRALCMWHKQCAEVQVVVCG